jgi:hypothetical protein
MADFEAQSGPTIPCYEKKMITNDSDTILEIKDLIIVQNQSPLRMSNHMLSHNDTFFKK